MCTKLNSGKTTRFLARENSEALKKVYSATGLSNGLLMEKCTFHYRKRSKHRVN